MATATSNGGSKAIESGRDFHLLTIGGGSGGVRASRFAARDGGTVGLVEMPFDRISSENTGGLGGTCVLRGCVPKKLMMYGSEFSAHFEDSVGFGWQPEFPPLDFQKLVARKDQEIKRLNGVYGRLLSNAGVTSLDGKGKVLDAHTVEVTSPDGDTNQYTADNILIATGGHAIKPDIPGAEYTVDSDEMLSLPEQPRKLIVIGSGYIALEFASIYKGLGTDVDLVYRAELPLRGFDHDMRQTLQTALDGRGIKQYSSNSPTAIEKRSDGRYIVKTDKGNELEADLVMMATGRKPNTDRPYLGLDNAGVELGKDGAVKVDQYSQTNVSSIWAVGDVTNRINLTPVALMEGLSEDVAAERGYNLDVYLEPLTPMRNTLSGRQEKGLMKMVVDSDTQTVLGMHMVGPDAGEIIQGFAAALKAGAKKQDIDSTVGVHPSTAEEFCTMRTPSRHVPPKS